jgi:predicted permease
MDTFLQDVRFALRSFRTHRATNLIAIACLGLGIGANTAIFSVVRAVLIDALPYQDPERLFLISETFMAQGKRSPGSAAPLNYYDFKARARGVEDMAGYTGDARDLADAATPERLFGVRSTANLFRVLGARPLLGRTFVDGEDQASAAPVAVIGEGFWRRRFGGNPRILDSTITLGGRKLSVIGVMPSSFDFPIRPTPNDYWIPLVFQPKELSSRASHWVQIVGRLRPGIDSARAAADLARIAADIAHQYPQDQAARSTEIAGVNSVVSGRVRPALLMLLGAVSLVLLIACANVANLLLVRGAHRRREMALRTALGARRSRIVGQLLTESVAIALAGGVLGVLVARSGLAAIIHLAAASLPRAGVVRLDWMVLTFVALISIVTGLTFGVLPALRVSRADLRHDLQDASGRAGSSRGHQRMLNLLMGWEIALSVLLLVSATLLLRGFAALLSVDPGFRPEGVVTFRVAAPVSVSDSMRFRAFYDPLIDRLRALPPVRAVGLTNMLPIQSSGINGYFNVVGQAEETNPSRKPFAEFRVVSADYFRALGIPVITGRAFTEHDTPATTSVLLVNEEFAKRYFPNENPIGKQIKPWRETPATIVGVVGSVRQRSLDRPASSEIYISAEQSSDWLGSMTFVIATSNVNAVMRSVREIVRSVAPQQAVYQLMPMADVVSSSIRGQLLSLVLLSVFAALALVLAAAGVYGVISYAVAERRREIGIRIALGARTHSVLWMVLRESGRVSVAGLVVGLAGALAVTTVLRSLLYDVGPRDPLSFALATIAAGLTAAVATIGPAIRAARVDPILAIRSE